jgi:hypothetical protein
MVRQLRESRDWRAAQLNVQAARADPRYMYDG